MAGCNDAEITYAAMRSRKVLRMPLSASLSLANAQAIDLRTSINFDSEVANSRAYMYCSAVLAIHSGHPTAVRSDTPTLQAWQFPLRVTVGTPIHSVSHVVVVPA
jgi:hypothetical protein